MFRNLGGGELLTLLLVGLVLFGPDRLPGLAKDAARGMRQSRKFLRT